MQNAIPIRLPLLLLLALLLLPSVALAERFEQDRFSSLEANLIESHQDPLSYAYLLRLDDLSEQIPLSQLEQSLARLLESDLLPLVETQVKWRLAELYAETGRWEEAEREIKDLGFLTKWKVIGPFPNEGMSGFEMPFLPEDGIDLSATVPGRFPDLRWQDFETKGRSGYLRLSSVVSPVVDSVSYLATVVESPADTEAVLWMSVDGAFKVWVNHELRISHDEDLGGPIDREGVKVTLKKGENLILIKVANEAGYAGLYARLSALSLQPLPLTHGEVDPATDRSAAQTLSSNDEVESLLDGILASAELEPTAARRAWAAYSLDKVNPSDVRSPGESMMLEVMDETLEDPELVLVAASVLEEPWRRRQHVEKGLERWPSEPRLLSKRIAQLMVESTSDRHDEIVALLEELEAQAPGSLALALLKATHLANQGLTLSAYEYLSGQKETLAEVPAFIEELQWRATAAQIQKDEIALLELLLSINTDIDSYRTDLASRYLQLDRADEALALLDEGLMHRPDARSLNHLKVDIYEATGQLELAREELKALVTALPTSADLWEVYGGWLLEQEEEEAALEAFRKSLSLEAQNETLRQLVRYLDASSESFEQAFLIEDFDQFGPPPETEDYHVLIDQKITLLHPNGLTSTFTQVVYEVITDEGVGALRALPVYYTPGEEILEVDLVRVIKPDGSIRPIFNRSEYSVADESIRMYYDYRQVALEFPDLDVGDKLDLRYRVSQVSTTNYFDNHFGDVWFMQDVVPKAFVRYVLLAPKDREIKVRLPDNFESLVAEGRAVMETREEEEHRITLIERTEIEKITTEGMMPGWAEVADYALFSTFEGWGEVATWYWNLAKDQWIVDSEIREVVAQLVEGVTSRRERVAKIHNYVVKNTRYVALEFGVHGYKPYRTTVCFRRRFGDCKDKASLLKVMLEEAGIPANIVLIRTRRNGDIDTDPASLTIFDHAIAYVPEFDLFLDGTAEFAGTSELPSMDQGTIALIVKDQGEYELKETAVAPASENQIKNNFKVELNLEGSAQVESSGEILGQFAPSYRQRYESSEKRLDYFEAEFSTEYPGAAVSELEFQSVESLEEPVKYTFTANIPSFLQQVGEVSLLYPHGHSSDLAKRLAWTTRREQDLVIPFPFEFHNLFSYTLPEGAVVETLPEDVTLESPFGAFSMRLKSVEGGLEVRTDLVIDHHQVPAADYSDFQAFLLEVDRTLNTPIQLRHP